MILYLGNNLSLHGNTPSSIEILGRLLSERYVIKLVSNKKNQILRWLDMMGTIIRYRHTTSVVLIDTYSTLGFYYVLGGAFICRNLSISYIPILRGGNLQQRLQQNPVLSRFIFNGARLLIAPSNYLFSTFKQFGFNNVQYIPNSIEIEAYKMKQRQSVSPRLLWVRSFHKVYNPIMAIKTLEKLLPDFPQATLCMVGPDRDGSLRQCKAYVHKIGLEDKVKFTGVLSKTAWHTLSVQYDIFINTTTVDNTPVSVMEAMALGLPVVSTNVGGVPYLITDSENGLLVNPGDTVGMVNKIDWLINNPEKALQIAKLARQHVETFDWNVVKKQWFTLLDGYEFIKESWNDSLIC